MNRIDQAKIRKTLKDNWWLPVMLTAGLLLLMLPSSDRQREEQPAAVFTPQEQRLSQVLSRIEGVEETYVLLSENPGRDKGFAGAVVVCQGAGSPQVRLRVVESVSAFTGLGTDRIVVQNLIS